MNSTAPHHAHEPGAVQRAVERMPAAGRVLQWLGTDPDRIYRLGIVLFIMICFLLLAVI